MSIEYEIGFPVCPTCPSQNACLPSARPVPACTRTGRRTDYPGGQHHSDGCRNQTEAGERLGRAGIHSDGREHRPSFRKKSSQILITTFFFFPSLPSLPD